MKKWGRDRKRSVLLMRKFSICFGLLIVYQLQLMLLCNFVIIVEIIWFFMRIEIIPQWQSPRDSGKNIPLLPIILLRVLSDFGDIYQEEFLMNNLEYKGFSISRWLVRLFRLILFPVFTFLLELVSLNVLSQIQLDLLQ